MKVGQIGQTFVVPGKTVFFGGVKSCVPSFTLKMRKSQTKLALAYTQIRDGGAKYDPPKSNRVK